MTVPPEINLLRTGAEPPPELQPAVGELRTIGYDVVGTYEIEAMPEVRLVGLVNTETRTYAAVFEHAEGGSWTDVSTVFDDGSRLTASSNASGQRDGPEQHERVFVPGASASEVHRQALQGMQRQPRDVSADAFVDELQRAYREDAAWYRDAAAPLAAQQAEDMLARIQQAADRGENPLAALGEMFGALGLADEEPEEPWYSALASKLGVEEEDLEDRGVVVHDGMDAEDLRFACELALELDFLPVAISLTARHWLATAELGNGPAEAFDQLNERLPEPHQLVRTAEVQDPGPAAFYEPRTWTQTDNPPPDLAEIESAFERWRTAVGGAGLDAGSLQRHVDHGVLYATLTVPGSKAIEAWVALRGTAKDAGFWPVVAGEGELGPTADGIPSPQTWLARAAELDPDTWLRLTAEIAAAEEDDDDDEAEDGSPEPTEPQPVQGYEIPRDSETLEFLPRVTLVLVPTTHGFQAPAYLQFGGFEDCPLPEVHVAMLARWHQRWGAEVVGISQESIELRLDNPLTNLDDARSVAGEIATYCPDVIEQGYETTEALAQSLVGSTVWPLWWE